MDAEISAVQLEEVNRYLDPLGWPKGMQKSLLKLSAQSPLRFFIIDDSGSMAGSDGHQILGTGKNKRFVQCSRWTELGESMRFHAGLAHASGCPTEFRLLNGAPPMVIGMRDGSTVSETNYAALLRALDGSPSGGTPLCRHIREITEQINRAAPSLRQNSQKASIIICTDGESSDGDLTAAMAPLKNLPVNIVVRLCTDDDAISEYWNRVDSQLELGLDILDDFAGEAKEITKANGWLVYGEPLHRMREWGISLKEFDLLDEAKLSSEQMRAICAYLLFGGSPRELPHPETDWKKFESTVMTASDTAPFVWNPLTRREERWLNYKLWKKLFNPAGGGCSVC